MGEKNTLAQDSSEIGNFAFFFFFINEMCKDPTRLN